MTPAQLQTLKTYIAGQGDLSSEPMNDDGDANIAQKLNILAAPDFIVWNEAAPISGILDAITFASYTPVDAVPTGASSVTDGTAMTFQNRALVIQTKQINLQNMTVGREVLNAGKANIRAALRDCVIALPAGANGGAISAGGASGVTVMNALTRKAKRGEKALTAGPQTLGNVTADVMGYEGSVSTSDVRAARVS